MSVQKMPMDMLMLAMRDMLPNQKIIFQQIFRFNPGNAINNNSLAKKEFEEYRDQIFNQYAPTNDRNQKDSHAFEAIVPDFKSALNNVARHFDLAYPTYS